MKLMQRGILVLGMFAISASMCSEQVTLSVADESLGKFSKKNPLESVFKKNDVYRLRVPLEQKDIELLVGGNISVNNYMVRNGTRLTKGIDDQINQWRQRLEFGIHSNFGKESTGGDPIVESHVVFGNTLFWRTGMTRSFDPLEGSADQDFINAPVQVFVNEAWMTVNLGTLSKVFDGMPTSVKAGYFPFLVGRGLSLGDRSYGGITYMGFPRQGSQTYLPKYAPGVQVHGELPTSNLSYDIYYSPMVSEDLSKRVQKVGRYSHIPERDKKNAHGRHLGAISMAYWCEPAKDTRVRVEPYVVYYNSQRQTIEGAADAPLYLMTFGGMLDVSVGPVTCNLEMATQYGKQDVLPWMYSLGDTNEFHPGYKVKLGGSMFVFDLAYQVQDYPILASMALGYFSGGDYPYNDTVGQFHAGEGGFATLTQSQQATDGKKDRTFKGFVPLRDWGYRGMWCNPLIMFSAGVIPRPVDVDLNSLTTFNDADCATNLIFLGLGGTWRPLQDKKALAVSGASFFHWEARPPHKWSVSAALPGQDADDGAVKNVGPGLGVKGWYVTDRASSFLGTEFNMVVDYKVAADCDLSVRGGIFFPAQLYADVAGQPNERSGENNNVFVYGSSGVATQSVVAKNDGLGRAMSYGLYTRFSYNF